MKRYAILLSLITMGYILGWTASVLRFGLPPLGFDRRPPRHEGPHGMFEGIGLNDDQKEAIRKIRAEEEDERQVLRERMDKTRREFEKLLDSSKDRELLQDAFNRMLEQKNAMEQAHFNSMMKVHQVLTLEQIKKLGEQRPKRGPGGRGPGRGPGGPGRPGHDHGPPHREP